jgi:hypothetical protein
MRQIVSFLLAFLSKKSYFIYNREQLEQLPHKIKKHDQQNHVYDRQVQRALHGIVYHPVFLLFVYSFSASLEFDPIHSGKLLGLIFANMFYIK